MKKEAKLKKRNEKREGLVFENGREKKCCY